MFSSARRTLTVLSLAAGAGWRAWRFSRRRFVRREDRERAANALWRQEGARLRRQAIRLGGLIIKVGQFLSARADVLPEAFTSELGSLQDVVPPVEWGMVGPRLETFYGKPVGEVFETFDATPVAAASLAQVYRARYRGQDVAVKVLRPGIERTVGVDLNAVGIAARWASRLTDWGRRFDLIAVWQELGEITLEELDLKGEAARLARFRRNFQEDSFVHVPRTIPELSGPRILVMEAVSGVKPDDLAGLREKGIDTSKLARNLIRSYMKQWLVDGFFHADPHPGNLFVQSDGSVTYVDFGMMAEVRPEDRKALRQLVMGVLVQDIDQVASALEALEFLRPTSDRARLRRALSTLIQELLKTPPPAMSSWQPTAEAEALAKDIRYFLHANTLQLPVRYTFLGRAMGILAGMVARLAPDQSFTRMMADGASRYVGHEGATGALDAATTLLARLAGLPGQLLDAAERLARGDIRAEVDLEPLVQMLERQQSASGAGVRASLALGALLATIFGQIPGWAHWVFGLVAVILAFSAFQRTR